MENIYFFRACFGSHINKVIYVDTFEEKDYLSFIF